MKYATAAMLIATTAHAQAPQEPPADHSGTYFCKATAAGGLSYDKNLKAWSSTTFDVADSSYTVKVTSTDKFGGDQYGLKSRSYNITVKKFGSQEKPSNCFSLTRGESGNEVVTFGDRVECRFFGTQYLFNFASNRYLVQFEGGFVWGDEEKNADTPYIEGGKCDKIN
ncbi:hypothetical protein [Rhizobium leguminosarum]|uniref:hypothetical protein n=1 Tax=Rhizobium leguminosarum TaxID=384 RepID=UPI00103C5540|nr:hypothetical protein [Rhizobium leguminosarum]TBY42264.1 hypothetical protein E0H54_29480 [Rhizobium leguminosarum bv. viciae]